MKHTESTSSPQVLKKTQPDVKKFLAGFLALAAIMAMATS